VESHVAGQLTTRRALEYAGFGLAGLLAVFFLM
jgi:hypothetical protein